MLAYGRLTGKVSGYIYYDYSDFYRSEAKSAVKKIKVFMIGDKLMIIDTHSHYDDEAYMLTGKRLLIL